jgi:hypothetical protein
MHRLSVILSYGQGGLAVAVLALLLAFSGRIPPRLPRWVIAAAALFAALPLAGDFLLSTLYLFSPTYIDHVEASVASVTQYFMQGAPVYPDLDSYTFHGLLYGPLLAELNSVGYLVCGGVTGSKLIGWAAAWLAVVLMVFTAPRAERNWAWVAGLVAPCCVLASFGNVLTADRADSLLLLFAVGALWSVVRLPGIPGLLPAALLAGLATDLKLHGAAYILPALALWAARFPDSTLRSRSAAGLAAGGVMAIGVALPFLPPDISVTHYLEYLRLGAKHGLSLEIFVWNCTFLLGLWIPALLVMYVVREQRARVPRHLARFAAALGVMELAVVIVASKPGAGSHHLLPFLGFHAFLVQHLLAATPGGATDSNSWRELPAARAAVTGLVAVLVGTAWPATAVLYSLVNFNRLWPSQQAAFEELHRLADRYPHGMMGIAGPESYALTILRPWLTLRGTRQTDYGAWMDWQLSGLSDAPLANALATCEIPFLFIPTGGRPFTMYNNYNGTPLFSDAVRTAFARRYTLSQPGQFYNVYGCAAASASIISP